MRALKWPVGKKATLQTQFAGYFSVTPDSSRGCCALPCVQAGSWEVKGRGIDAEPWPWMLEAPETPMAPGTWLPWPGGSSGSLWKQKAMGSQGSFSLNLVLKPPSGIVKWGLLCRSITQKAISIFSNMEDDIFSVLIDEVFWLMVQYSLLLLAISIFFAQLVPTYNYKNNRVMIHERYGRLLQKI